MQVIILKFDPANHPNKRTKCGTWPGFGHNSPDSQWGIAAKIFNDVFKPGTVYEIEEFQRRYSAMISMLFNKNSYGKRQASLSMLKNGPEHGGAIKII